MIDQRSVLAVIPARGGSKGLPLKNLRAFQGHSLLAHVGMVVQKVPEIDRAVVSTDHEGIAEEAERFGLAAPFRRPEPLSGDRITDWQVLDHALRTMEGLDKQTYDLIVMLQPTSPLRRSTHVRQALRQCVDGDWDSVWTVSEISRSYHPIKHLQLEEAGHLSYRDPQGANFVARQMLEPTYRRNGAAYVFTRRCILDQKQILGTRSSAVIIDEPQVGIDTESDLELASFYWERAGRSPGQ
jgi:CMP-N-acetylneuraminic acid synthetase